MPPPPPSPPLSFTHPPALSPFTLPAAHILTHHPTPLTGVATAAVVFDPHGRVLLLQRAAHDSMPNLWEVPGGAVDADDPSILHGALRELWEEAGLRGTVVVGFIPEREVQGQGDGKDGEEEEELVRKGLTFSFTNREGVFKTFYRLAFEVQVEGGEGGVEVRLDPGEHQDYGMFALPPQSSTFRE